MVRGEHMLSIFGPLSYLPLPQPIGMYTLYLYQIFPEQDGTVNEYSNVECFDTKVLLNC